MTIQEIASLAGVSVATVSRVIKIIALSFLPIKLSIISVNGTKVISATSFVISIEEKKHKRHKTILNEEKRFTYLKSFSARSEKTPILLSPAVTAIKLKSKESVLKSIYSKIA